MGERVDPELRKGGLRFREFYLSEEKAGRSGVVLGEGVREDAKFGSELG